MGRLKTKIADTVLQPINPSLIIVLGVYTIVWGLWLASPFWNVFTTAALYSEMSHYPEWAWGLLAILSGAGILHGVYRGSNRDLRGGAAIGFYHWLLVAVFYFIGDWHNTGGITSLTFSIYAGLVYLNLHKNKHSRFTNRS